MLRPPAILVIQLMRLGDAIQTTPAILELRRAYPEARIEWLLLGENRAVGEGLPIDALHLMPDAARQALQEELRLFYLKQGGPRPERAEQWLQQSGLRETGFDRILNCDFFPLSAWIATQLKPRRLQGGRINSKPNHVFPEDWFSYLMIGSQHENCAGNRLNIVELYRGATEVARPPAAEAHPHIDVAETLSFTPPPAPWIALNPGSSDPKRRWPAERFAALAAALNQNGWTPALVGGPGDREVCAEVAARCAFPILNVAGRTRVDEMARLLQGAALLISNDTGAVHIAAATGTPVVGLHGRQVPHFHLSAPWSSGNVLLRGGFAGEEIPLELVVAAAAWKLAAGSDGEFSRLLRSLGQEAYRTEFLPPQDRLGGIVPQPLHTPANPVEERFLMGLRAILVWDFSGRAGPAPQPDDAPHFEAAAVQAYTAEIDHWRRRFDSLGEHAREARHSAQRNLIPRLQRQAKAIEAEVRELFEGSRRATAEAAHLVLRHLDLQIGFDEEGTIAARFGRYSEFCRQASDRLGRALAWIGGDRAASS